MRFSLSWIGDYVDLAGHLDGGPQIEELARKLTDVGLAVEDCEGLVETSRGREPYLEIEVTTNRVDCMNHLGVARELAVALDRPLAPPVAADDGEGAVSDLVQVAIADPALCPRYAAVVVRGLRVGPSPEWLRDRLLAAGQRPINNVVDVTNFVMLECGQPLHAFDLGKLRRGPAARIGVRRARGGERLTTLDGQARELSPEVLLITDGERPVALAGIMGGQDTEVGPGTTDVLLESAHFDRLTVRRGARRLGMHTDASHRFERGVDPEGCVDAAFRAAALLAEVAGGRRVRGAVDVRREEYFAERRLGRLDRIRLSGFVGIDIPAADVHRVLVGLGFGLTPAGEEVWTVSVPSWRRFDFELMPTELWGKDGENVEEQDLFEEVLRHFGFARVPAALPALPGPDAGRNPAHARAGRIRAHLAACGYSEAIDYAFGSAEEDAAYPVLRREGAAVALANPLSERYALLRRSLLPGLVESARANQRRGAGEVRLFELGHVFPGGQAAEEEIVALVCGGRAGTPWEREVDLDLFDLKGAVESLAREHGVELEAAPAELPGLVAGSSGRFARGGETVGHFGQLAQGEGSFPLFVAELLTSALAAAESSLQVTLPSRFPGVAADLTFTHALSVAWREIADFIRARRVPDLADFGLEVRYQGEGVPAGAVNTTVHFLYNAADRSLTQEEVNRRHLALAEELRARFGWKGEGA